jgi:hypothetical protein
VALLGVGFFVTMTYLPAARTARPNPATATPVITFEPVPPAGSPAAVDFVDVLSSGGFDSTDLSEIAAVSTTSGAQSSVMARATIEMDRIDRGATTVKGSPPGMFFPMDSIAVDPTAVTATMGAEVATVLARGDVVMSRTSASVEGASIGDHLGLQAWDGSHHSVTVGAVVPDAAIVGAELAFPQQLGADLGISRPSRVRYTGTRTQLDAVLAALPAGSRSVPSWVPPSPDDAISQARTKQLLGEFAYARKASGAVTIDPAWKAAHLVTDTLPLIGTIECHRVVAAAAVAALNDIRQAGLARLINTADTYRNGGCYGPREQRASDGTSGRTLSRHSWGGAIDINPGANPQGGKPSMDQRLVTIFRRHGFIWGGNFATPDGMHFEYVGS